MSEVKKKIIDNFCTRFLKEMKEKPNLFSDILNMSPNILKDCSNNDSTILAEYKYKKIRDLGKIKYQDISNIAKTTNLNENKLRNWVLAAQLVSRAWKKRSLYLKKNEMKIGVMGLDNAGKTSMLEILSGKTQIGEIIDKEPTIGVEIRKIQSGNMNMAIWDFGGQIGHRHDYFSNPEEYFLQIDLIIFLFDVQDDDRFQEGLEYFRQIIEMVDFLKESPYFLIFINKCDPDLISDPDFLINLEYLRVEILSIFKKYKLSFELSESSIYNIYSVEPEFAKTFKNFFQNKNKSKSTEDMLSNIAESLLSNNIAMMKELRSIKEILLSSSFDKKNLNLGEMNQIALSNKEFKKSLREINKPPPPPSMILDKSENDKNFSGGTRTELMSELKKLFTLRRIVDDD